MIIDFNVLNTNCSVSALDVVMERHGINYSITDMLCVELKDEDLMIAELIGFDKIQAEVDNEYRENLRAEYYS